MCCIGWFVARLHLLFSTSGICVGAVSSASEVRRPRPALTLGSSDICEPRQVLVLCLLGQRHVCPHTRRAPETTHRLCAIPECVEQRRGHPRLHVCFSILIVKRINVLEGDPIKMDVYSGDIIERFNDKPHLPFLVTVYRE